MHLTDKVSGINFAWLPQTYESDNIIFNSSLNFDSFFEKSRVLMLTVLLKFENENRLQYLLAQLALKL